MTESTETTPTAEKKAGGKLMALCGICVTAVTAIVYFLTLSRGAFPGQSAGLIAAFTGIEPPSLPSHPVWGACVNAIGSIGMNGMALRLNIFSMVVSVACAWLFYTLFVKVAYSVIDNAKVPTERAARAATAGGVIATLAFSFSVPCWIASTRLHFQIFDMFLLLCLAHLLVIYIRTNALAILMFSSLLFGVAAVECVHIALFLPVFAFFAMHAWLRNEDFRSYRVFLAILFGLIGVSVILLVARRFFLSEDAALREYTSYWVVVRDMLRESYHTLRRAIPDVGWLFIVVFVVLPFVATLAIAPRALSETRDWSFIFFHIALTAVVIATLANTPISRWGLELQRPTGALPVFIYAMTAFIAGYVVVYWYLIVANRSYIPEQLRTLPYIRAGFWSAYAFGWLAVAIVLFASVINGFEASGRRGAFADKCARILLDSLKDREWLVSDGMFDNHLRLEAARSGQSLKFIALQHNDNPVYLRRLKKLIETDPDFDNLDRIRLQNSADLGALAFLQDWMESDSNVVERIAVMSAPDILIGAGCTVVPNYFCFYGVRDADSLKDIPVIDRFEPFWTEMRTVLAPSRGLRDPIAGYRAAVRRQVGFVANNAGVMLEDLGRDEEAYEVYGIVRQIDPNNVSALLNRVEMLHRKQAEGFHSGDRATVERELREFVGSMKHKLPIWSLSRVFGYVRSPVLFAQLGWTWALSGQPGMALAGMRRAASVATTLASRTRVRQAMADILLSQNADEESESIYEDILNEDPENQKALISMSRIAARRGTFDKAREWLERAKAAGVDNVSIAIESAALDLASNKPEDARIKLTEVTEMQPRNLQAWGMLAISVIQMRDFEDVEKRILPRMESVAGTPDNYLVQITRGQLAYTKGREHYRSARDSFERASALRPGLALLHEWILRLDFLLADKQEAEAHARTLLRQDRNNGFANYIMGSLMLERGRPDVAEDYLRRSVSSSRSPEALNDLAELLRKTGNYEEAEKQVRAAIDLAPDFYITYDTLGGVLSDTERLNEAEQAYAKALEIFKDDLRVHLNLAKLLYKKGNLVKAREIVTQINPRRSELPPFEQEELRQLVHDLTPGRK